MREIKFRGKSTLSIDRLNELGIGHENGWVFGNLITNGKNPFIVGDLVEIDTEYISHEFWSKVLPETVGQYTGLKDKNGKEIYEGDIVEEYQGMDEVYFHEIKWDEDSLSYIFHELSLSDNLMVWDINTSALKVIGNIYEHPHLLEGKA